MADFLETAVTKSAVRTLRNRYPTSAGLKTLVDGVISGNPWGCIPYTKSGATYAAVNITKETYTGTVLYQDLQGKVIGKITVAAPTLAGFDSAISNIQSNATLETLMGGDAIYNNLTDRASIAVQGCWSDGDVFNVTFTRDVVRVSAYSNDTIVGALETWADGIPALE